VLLALSDAVTTGIFTLLGAAVGIALGGVVDYKLEQRREGALLRQAKRLVAEEVFLVCVHAEHLHASGHFPKSMGPDSAPLFPTQVWLEHRAALAKGLTEKQYKLLSRVETLLTMIRSDLIEGAAATPPPLPPDLVDAASRLRELARVAYWSLTGEQWDEFKAPES
jgi:hypothetical protein